MKTKQLTFYCLSVSLLCLIISCTGAKEYNATAESDLKNAFTASQAYFVDYPDGQLDLNKLKEVGFNKSEGVIITIIQSGADNLIITSEHPSGTKIFKVSHDGNMQSSDKS
jgi:hypothetical protein